MILAVLIGAGEGVVSTSTIIANSTNEMFTETNVILAEGTESYWLTWVFSGFAAFNLILFVKDIARPA